MATTRTATLANGHTLTVTILVPGDARKHAAAPYFSVTAVESNPRQRGSDKTVACGQMHDAVLAQWPDLHDAIALHLADAAGVPMHAAADGWYWLAVSCGGLGQKYHGGDDKMPSECRDVLTRLLRISAAEAADMINSTWTIARQEGADVARANFELWLADLAPRWAAEADAVATKYAG